MTVAAGEIWVADVGDETRRELFVISDPRFHRLAERAVVAPVLDAVPASARLWHIRLADDRAVAVNQLGTVPVDRLLQRVETASFEALRQARRAVHAITN